jgi:hypothetical protein
MVVVSVANSTSTKASMRLDNCFVATRFAAIVGVVVAGVAVVRDATLIQRAGLNAEFTLH